MKASRLKNYGTFAVVGLAMAAATAAPVTFPQIPPAVQIGIKAQLGNGTLGEIDRDEEDGEVTYTFEVTKAGRSVDYTLNDSGALISVEVTLSETPLAVQKSIQTQIGRGTLESIDKTLEEGKVIYEVDWKSKDGADHSFNVLEDGKLDSVQITLEEAPPAVQATIKRETGPGQIKDLSKTFDDNAVSYDFTLTRDGAVRDISVGEGGKLESRQVFLAEIPPAAQNTIKQSIGPGRLVRIDHVPEGKKGGAFEVEAQKDGKSFYFSVGPKGAYLGAE